MRKIYLFIFSIMILVGCRTIEEPVVVKGVLDGRIDSDGFPVVVLTSSISPQEGEVEFIDKVIRWARVTVSDGETEVILTGGPSSALFPPYRYYNYQMIGEPGKTYSVHAQYADIDLYASAKMLLPTPIDDIKIEKIKGNSDKYSMTLSFNSPDDGPAYYYVSIRNDIKARTLPAFLATVETTAEPNRRYTIPLMRPRVRVDTIGYEPYFLPGEEWEVILNRVSEQEFRYWRDYDNALITGSTPVMHTDEGIKGNVEGGYGLWSVCGSSVKLISIPEEE